MGTITGVVTDPSNAVVPDATVTIKDTATGEVRTTTTNNAGRYVFVNVQPGQLRHHGHQNRIRKDFDSKRRGGGRQVSTNNVTLKVGAESQTVEVQATGVELQTLNATVGNTVNGLALDSLPTHCP